MYRKIRAKFKEFQRKMGKKILDTKKNSVDLKFEDIKKILFIRYDGKIGDYIVSSFIYREVKKQRPDIQIDVVGINKNESLFLQNKYVDNFYKLKKTKYKYMNPLARQLKKENYDLIIDPTETLKNKDLFFIKNINAKVNFGYAKENYKIFNKNISKNTDHITDVYKSILEDLGFNGIDKSYDVPVNQESEEKVKRFFSENNLDKVIVVNLFGAKKATKFTYEKSLEILKYILEKKNEYKIVLLYSPSETELLDQILKKINNENLYFYGDSKSIFDSISIIKRSDIVISPDTSIVHIADGLGKKIIAFYTSNFNDYNKWHIDQRNKIIRVDNVNNINIDFLD